MTDGKESFEIGEEREARRKKLQFIIMHLVQGFSSKLKNASELMMAIEEVEMSLGSKNGQLLRDKSLEFPKDEEKLLDSSENLSKEPQKEELTQEYKPDETAVSPPSKKALKKKEEDDSILEVMQAWNMLVALNPSNACAVIFKAPDSGARRRAILNFIKAYNPEQREFIFKQGTETGTFVKDNGDVWRPHLDWALSNATKLLEQAIAKKAAGPSPKDIVADLDKKMEEGLERTETQNATDQTNEVVKG